MSTPPSGPAYRRKQLIVGILFIVLSGFFWVLLFRLWTTCSPSLEGGQWLFHLLVSLFLFGLASQMGSLSLKRIATVAGLQA